METSYEVKMIKTECEISNYKVNIKKINDEYIITFANDFIGEFNSNVNGVIEKLTSYLGTFEYKIVEIFLHSSSDDNSIVSVSVSLDIKDENFIKKHKLSSHKYFVLEYLISPLSKNNRDLIMGNKIFILNGNSALCQDIENDKVKQITLITVDSAINTNIGLIQKFGMSTNEISCDEVFQDITEEESIQFIKSFLSDYFEEMDAHKDSGANVYMFFKLAKIHGNLEEPIIRLCKGIDKAILVKHVTVIK